MSLNWFISKKGDQYIFGKILMAMLLAGLSHVSIGTRTNHILAMFRHMMSMSLKLHNF